MNNQSCSMFNIKAIGIKFLIPERFILTQHHCSPGLKVLGTWLTGKYPFKMWIPKVTLQNEGFCSGGQMAKIQICKKNLKNYIYSSIFFKYIKYVSNNIGNISHIIYYFFKLSNCLFTGEK